MFRNVCALLNKWSALGLKMPVVSVNVSIATMNMNSQMERYDDIVREMKPDARYIEIEFTESTALNNEEHLISVMEKIHSYGASCSMDDFGSSYSNLSSLERFNFDKIKLDKSLFDNGFPSDSRSMKLVYSNLELIKSLGMETLAEGIETREQMEALKRLGCCDIIQGYYYDRPLPIAEFESKYLMI